MVHINLQIILKLNPNYLNEILDRVSILFSNKLFFFQNPINNEIC